MSVHVGQHGCFQANRLADLMGTAAFTDSNYPDVGNRSQREDDGRKQKQKKHKKHRHRHRSRSIDLKSIDADVKFVKDRFNDIVDKDSSGDYISKHKDDLISIDDMPDFTWLTKDFKFTDITNTFGGESIVSDSCTEIAEKEPGLSQRPDTSSQSVGVYDPVKYIQDDRATIEQEIQDKYAEIDVLISKINAKQQRLRRRRKYQLRKYDNANMDDHDQWLPPYVNICPIRRSKRCAQPIRNALLVRTAMRKACKGVLGSCCGKGCWATWKWVNLKRVISDYE